MKDGIQDKIDEIFKSIKIFSEYSSEVTKIKDFKWNQNLEDFIVEYYVNKTKFVFQYNEEVAKDIDPSITYFKNPLEQLEFEVKYIKRMSERGIGAKEYFPFTHIEP